MSISSENRTDRTADSTGWLRKSAGILRGLDGWTAFFFWKACAAFLLLFSVAPPGYSAMKSVATSDTTSTEPGKRELATAREFYNEGTRYFEQTNLWRAEYNLERALSFQDDRLQPPALYNLGHIRFSQGAEELKKGPPGGKTAGVGRAVLGEADEAIKDLDQALAGSNATTTNSAQAAPETLPDETVKKLVDSYLKGRGARRDIRAATKLVKAALQAHQNTLMKWDRSSGDFKSAVELNQKDEDARYNADVVDRSIAKLIDQIKQLEQIAMNLGMKQQQLGEKLKQCRGKIPAPQMPPGAAGDDEEDDRFPNGKEPGQEEAGKKDEQKDSGLTAEQAAWLLDAYKLDSDRRLPMTEAKRAQQPPDRSKPTW